MAQIADSIHIIILTVMFIIVLIYSTVVIVRMLRRKLRIRDASREISLLKMDLLSKQAHLQNLIEDSVEWTQSDLREYDETLDDTRILKGKLDKGMTVADARTKKLELMNETVDLFETLQKIRSFENRLEDAPEGRRRT
ncbi:MAG: hypothetical protein DRN37_05925 [Thermoplasmata archaeon]|nr:MAG: hypothetical protein B6U90_03265 [Thermoplasmatales archaeon ex4484_6]RLF57768.1 MAG: hypothetical protein DRN37_05925 [Thermoplasmata archaeon]RLF69600.1 MAG: hypothetical protein DRN57_00245 [Thermoplasmata archaeon]HHD16066.1 hypothetical protein [Euryarchaeota archaeon]